MLICKYCNKNISSGSYIKDFWGNVYHAEHKKVVATCSYCGRLDGGTKLSDGNVICKTCKKDSIDNLGQVVKEYKWVSDILANKGFDIKKYKTEIFLLDRKNKGKTTREEPGYINFSMKKVNGVIQNISFKIFIVKGLPRSYFIETLAHEMIHQWLILFAQDKLHPKLNEGASNYGAYLVLNVLKTPLSSFIITRMLKDPHPYYGKGFRKVLDYSKKYGHSQLLTYLKSHNKI
ncbi:MAG: protein DA1 [Spirochaetaceae bacterium]